MDGIIQQNFKELFSDDNNKLGRFTVGGFKNLNKVLQNTEEDFLIFDNGGTKLEIIFNREIDGVFYPAAISIDFFLNNHRTWVYCYQLNQKQTILKRI